MLDEKKFLQIISKSLNVSAKKVSLKLKKTTLDEWDSLGHLAILTAVENATSGKAGKLKDIANFSSLSQLFNKLKKSKLAK